MNLSKTLAAFAVAGVVAGLGQATAIAADMKPFNVGILGGKNQADRLRNWGSI